MGLAISKHPVDVLVVGLDKSGKTTVVDWLASKTSRTVNDAVTLPTIGFSARRFKFGNTTVTVLDMSGQVRRLFGPSFHFTTQILHYLYFTHSIFILNKRESALKMAETICRRFHAMNRFPVSVFLV